MAARIDKIILVGHCGADQFMLESAVERVLGSGLSVVAVNDDRELDAVASRDVLWLVNRQLDGRFETRHGIDLIRRYRGGPNPPVTLLVSNFRQAQQQAMDVGAVEGFGKAQLSDPAAMAVLRRVTGRSACDGAGRDDVVR